MRSGEEFVNPKLVVALDEELARLEPAQRIKVVNDRNAGIFGNNIKFVKAGTQNLAAVQGEDEQSMVLIALESEKFTADVAKAGKRALVLNVPDNTPDNNKPEFKGILRAAVVLLVTDESELPSFLKPMGKNIFRYLPKLAAIEWQFWMTAVKKTTVATGSAA